MATTITSVNMLEAVDGSIRLEMTVPKQEAEATQNAVRSATDKLKQGKTVVIVFTEEKKRRSLDANAYFHVLVEKIAQELKTASADEVKSNLVTNYGVPMYTAAIPENANINALWKYSRYIGDTDDGRSEYMLYKATHEMNTGEMARLIDGAIHEAQELGIQTMPDNEIERLKSLWR